MKNKIISIKTLLNEKNIGVEDLIDTALELYIYDPKIGAGEKFRQILRNEFNNIFEDINATSLVLAGFLLEKELSKGNVKGLDKKKYSKDPIDLIADEMLGIQIASYIAGTRAMFEFERFDKKKPGILKRLPPILDDVIAGLISGVLVKACSK